MSSFLRQVERLQSVEQNLRTGRLAIAVNPGTTMRKPSEPIDDLLARRSRELRSLRICLSSLQHGKDGWRADLVPAEHVPVRTGINHRATTRSCAYHISRSRASRQFGAGVFP